MVYQLLGWMVWMRLLILMMLIIASFLTCIVVGIMVLGRRRTAFLEETERVTRYENAKNELKKLVRKYDPAKYPQDKEVICCIICFEEYSLKTDDNG